MGQEWLRARPRPLGGVVAVITAVAAAAAGAAAPAAGTVGRAAIQVVSVAPDGAAGDGISTGRLGVSAGGRYVAFDSYSSNLVPGDDNGQPDVFVRDMVAGRTVLASVGVDGAQGNGESRGGSISADGRYVAFDSYSSNLVPGDDNGSFDVFVRDLWRGSTILASVGIGGGPADIGAHGPNLSADGRHVVFTSSSSNLVPGDTTDQDAFVRDLAAARTELVSVGGSLENVARGESLSADGRFVAFVDTSGLLPGPPPPPGAFFDQVVYVRDRLTRTTRAVSYGIPVDPRAFVVDASGPSLSADGRIVVFHATGWLGVGVDPITNVWARDLRTGAAELISADRHGHGSTVPGQVTLAGMSADGRYVTFGSVVPLTRGGEDHFNNVYRRDRRTGRLTLVTRDLHPPAPEGYGVAIYSTAISADGQHVAFGGTYPIPPPAGGNPTVESAYLWSTRPPQ